MSEIVKSEAAKQEKKDKPKNKTAVAMAIAALGPAVVGATIGTLVESHDVNLARAKVLTIDTCLSNGHHALTIDRNLQQCLHEGVPGGASVDDKGLRVGEPLAFVESVRQHNQERTNFHPLLVAEWTLSGFALGLVIA